MKGMIMAVLTEEMKDLLRNQLAYVATVSDEGIPDIGPKMSLYAMDDSHLAYYERTAGQTYRNLRANGRLVVCVVDYAHKKGYRFRGTVVLHENDQIHADALAYADEHGLKHPAVVPVMTITQIEDLAPAHAGQTVVEN